MELYKIANSILDILNKNHINEVEYGTYFKNECDHSQIQFFYDETNRQFYERYKKETGIDMFEIDKLQNAGEEPICITVPGENAEHCEKISIEIPIDCDDKTYDESYLTWVKYMDKYEKHVANNKYVETMQDQLDKVYIEKFGHSVKDDWYEQICEFTIEHQLIQDLLLVGRHHDAYGSGCYRLNERGHKFHVFSNYDNGSNAKNADVVMSLMLVDDENRDIFLADIKYQKSINAFRFISMQYGEFPEQLWKYGVREFCGKRSFYWNIEKQIVNLRCDDEIRKEIDEKYQSAKFFEKNVSGGRVKIQLKPFNPK